MSAGTSLLQCPVCQHPYEGQADCTQCTADLRLMLGIWDQSILFYNHALILAKAQCWTQALEEVNRAILYVNQRSEFHLFRGKILAHLHRYKDANAAWEFCVSLDSDSNEALNCIKQLQVLLGFACVPASQKIAEKTAEKITESVQESPITAPQNLKTESLPEAASAPSSLSTEKSVTSAPTPTISSKISKHFSELQPRFDSIFQTFSQALTLSSQESSLFPVPA